MRRLGFSFFSNKRGITPVLSSLLLTAVVVAAMTLATTATYIITTNMKETMSERIIIEDLWFDAATSEISICVRNVGKVRIQISAVYVNDNPQFFSSLSDLEVDTYGWINASCWWISGDLYHIDIVTKRGSHAGGYYEAP